MAKSTQLVVIGAGPGGYAAAFYAADRGMNVTLVDLHAALNTSTDLTADGVHPNDLGHSKIAAAYQAALGAAPVTYTLVSVYLGSDGKYYVGTETEKREIALVG